jgi:hypothetical protein
LISWIIAISLAVLAGDALYARMRLRLRTRTAHQTRRVNHTFGSEGWRSVGSIGEVTGVERAEVEVDENPFASIIGRRRR